jgi:hypothetical protein
MTKRQHDIVVQRRILEPKTSDKKNSPDPPDPKYLELGRGDWEWARAHLGGGDDGDDGGGGGNSGCGGGSGGGGGGGGEGGPSL